MNHTNPHIPIFEKFVAVGGMLHGRKILVPDGARIVKQHAGTGPTVHYVRTVAEFVKEKGAQPERTIFYRVGGMTDDEALRLFLKLHPTNP